MHLYYVEHVVETMNTEPRYFILLKWSNHYIYQDFKAANKRTYDVYKTKQKAIHLILLLTIKLNVIRSVPPLKIADNAKLRAHWLFIKIASR